MGGSVLSRGSAPRRGDQRKPLGGCGTPVVAKEQDRFLPQLLSKRHAGAIRELPLRLLAHDRLDRQRPEPGDIGSVVGQRHPHVREEELRVRLGRLKSGSTELFASGRSRPR